MTEPLAIKSSEQSKLVIDALAAGIQLHLPEVVVYQDENFGGWSYRTNLDVINIGDAMNDQVTSIIVVSGTWQFYRDENYGVPMGNPLPPGYYANVVNFGIENDAITSFKCIAL